jgi:hypothetical protein
VGRRAIDFTVVGDEDAPFAGGLFFVPSAGLLDALAARAT